MSPKHVARYNKRRLPNSDPTAGTSETSLQRLAAELVKIHCIHTSDPQERADVEAACLVKARAARALIHYRVSRGHRDAVRAVAEWWVWDAPCCIRRTWAECNEKQREIATRDASRLLKDGCFQ